MLARMETRGRPTKSFGGKATGKSFCGPDVGACAHAAGSIRRYQTPKTWPCDQTHIPGLDPAALKANMRTCHFGSSALSVRDPVHSSAPLPCNSASVPILHSGGGASQQPQPQTPSIIYDTRPSWPIFSSIQSSMYRPLADAFPKPLNYLPASPMRATKRNLPLQAELRLCVVCTPPPLGRCQLFTPQPSPPHVYGVHHLGHLGH